MRNIFLFGLCFVSLVLYGCGLTAAQLNQMSEGLVELSEQYQQGTAQIMNNSTQRIPKTTNQATFGSSYRRSEPRHYVITTEEGLQHRECMTLSDGYTFCY